MTEGVTVAEAKLIAQEAAKSALHEHQESLPHILKPVMYEVAENVARRGSKDMHTLFTHIFGADVHDQNHLRDLHKDLYWLRDQRVSHEQRVAIRRQELTRAFFKYLAQAIITAIIALLMLLGINTNNWPRAGGG